MGDRFIVADRETPFLFPPSVQEWLPEDHLARFGRPPRIRLGRAGGTPGQLHRELEPSAQAIRAWITKPNRMGAGNARKFLSGVRRGPPTGPA